MTDFVAVAAAPWLLSLALGARWLRVGRQAPPGWTVATTSSLAVLAACAVLASLVAVTAVLASSSHGWMHLLAVVPAAYAVWRTVVAAGHVRRVVHSVRSTARFGRAAASSDGVVVVETSAADAFAVPSGGGAVVITTGLVDALSDDEVQAVLDHERGHLRFRHPWWIQMAEISASFDPLLRPVVTQVRNAAERHADEYAAQRTDRRTVMTALARTALVCARTGPVPPSPVVRGTGGDVAARALALSGPPPRGQRAPLVIALGAVGITVGMLIAVLGDVTQDVVSPEYGEAPTTIGQ